MTYCAVKGCHNSSHYHGKHLKIAFHSFPSDPIVAALWIEKLRLNRKQDYWKPTKYTKICSKHFDDKEKYMTKGGLCKLRQGAVPTKALHISCSDRDGSDDQVKLSIESTLQPSTSQENANVEKIPSIQENLQPSTPRISGTDDDLESIFDTPRKVKLRKKLKKKTLLHIKHSKLIKSLRQKNLILRKNNKSMKEILIELKKKRFIDNDISNILSENVFAAELYNNLVKKYSKNKKRPMPKYTPEFRKFCLTLHFYSPQAYRYVRKTFNSCLPHPKTIYNWYRSTDGSPGFTDEAFKILKLKAESSNKKLICNLVTDEMAIRPQNIKGGHGDVDIGAGSSGSSDTSIKATEAFVFLLVCQNEHWKIPLGYFLIHGLSGTQKKNLINIYLTKCHEVGIKVVSLTFDGHPTNISAMELLGCSIKDPANLKTSFKHPVADHNVAVFLDLCHMVKLVRNHFEDKKTLLDKDENEISWDYLLKLNDLQEKDGLHAANKLTRKHLEFRNTIMKVKLATQLLSRSVAIGLKLCREVLNLEEFKESLGTEKFILLINNIFDIFNSRRKTQHGFSQPLSSSNKKEVLDYLSDAKQYILDLKIKITRKMTFKENNESIKIKLKGFESVLKTNTSTGFKGILICIESLKYLYTTLVQETHELSYLTTYRLSQDHLELFFGMIRMHGGHNDNPNALQFKGAYRKLLCHVELQAGDTGNCLPLENVPILTCSSALQCINTTTLSERFDEACDESTEQEKCPIEIDFDYLSTSIDDPDFKNYVVGYIAGNVVRHLSKKIKCSFCLESMLSKDRDWYHKLVSMRDNGGLVYASKEVYSICAISENYLRKYIAHNTHLGNTSEAKLALIITKNLIGKPLFPNAVEHVNSHHHLINLVRLIIERYLRIRFFYESKKDNIARKILSKRQMFRKQIQLTGF